MPEPIQTYAARMRIRIVFHGLMVAASLLCLGCSESKREPVTVYSGRGEVKKIDPESRTLTVHHDEIPGFMEAMTMPFHVKNPEELKGIETGDTITFRLNVAADRSWIDQISKTTAAVKPPEPAVRPSVRLVRDVEPLNVGDMMPEYRFTNQLGQAVSLSQFKGQALALTFIFTRCPMPDFCPRMTQHFAAAYKQLSSMPNAPTNWHLISISFDPHFDQPPVLKSYAERFGYNPEHWSFVTGALIDIDAITEQFNLPVVKQGENWDHTLRTVVIDASGRIQKIFIGNMWKPEELTGEIIKAAQSG